MRFSMSRLNEWQSCALKAKFHQLDHLPQKSHSKAEFGTIIHMALEQYGRTGDIVGAKKLFLDEWNNVQPDVWDRYTTFQGLKQKGIEILRDHHSRQRWEKKTIVAVEHSFLVPFGDYELTGKVDLMEVKKNHRGKEILRVIDWKTSSRKPSFSELYLNIQGSVYLYASLQPEFWLGNGDDFPPVPNGEWYWEMLQEVPRRFIWYHVWSDSELDGGSRDQADFDRVYRQCIEIEKAIKYEVFIPTISHDTCSYCSYRDGPCPVSVPKKEDVQAEENAWL